MTVVVGTAGHIDHGKTALLRALTGIDADRLPEERRRGMTIDVGFAHLGLPDGSELDFVDVPGHHRLIGNMLVGASEIDAVLLVVAADDGPRAQTIEHLELLNALGLRHAIAVITKIDMVDASRVAHVGDEVERLLSGTGLAGSPVLAASSVDGRGIDALRAALVELRDRVLAAPPAAAVGSWPSSHSSRLAIDRVFTVKGRGLVVTGTLRGGSLSANASLRLVPGGGPVRARELQVHGRVVERAGPGRTAVNVVGVDASEVHRGVVLTDDASVTATDRLLVRLSAPLPDRARVRAHLGTAATDGAIGRSGRDAIDLPDSGAVAIVRLAAPLGVSPGDRFVLRRATSATRVVGGIVLDPTPPRGISRRRQTPERLRRLVAAVEARDLGAVTAARLDLHGALVDGAGRIGLAVDVVDAVADDVARALTANGPGTGPVAPGLAATRARAAGRLRQLVTLRRDEAATAASALLETFAREGRIVRDGERLRLPGSEAPSDAMEPELAAAMDRLERALAVVTPPSLADAARAARCPGAGIRALEHSGRIVILDRDLAYAASIYRRLEAQALELAARGPVTPALLRDETGTSRKYVMAILADLDRRGILRRVDAGHVPGPRAATVTAAAAGSRAGRVTPAGAGSRAAAATGERPATRPLPPSTPSDR